MTGQHKKKIETKIEKREFTDEELDEQLNREQLAWQKA